MDSGELHAAERGPRLSAALDQARERGFVGRGDELRSFVESLSGTSPVRVLFLHGPGGIGKTTLLDAMGRHAARIDRTRVYLDARDVACSASAVSEAIAERSTSSGAIGAAAPDVLLIDGFELFEPLDRWFREALLPSRPAGSVTVLAGRAAPPPGWRLDPGWRHVVRVHELTGLDVADSHELLTRLGVEEAGRDAMAGLARGHPLVLAMLAEASRGGAGVATHLADAPDVVARLCRMIVDDVPDAAHRTGLATCAHATRMTADLLTRTVGPRADEVWTWLESRPYVRRGAIGLFLHDVVRELFEAEFAHRAPDAFASLHRAVRGYFSARLVDPAEPHPDRAAAEVLLLHRRGPLAAETARLRDGGLLTVSSAAAEDQESFFALIEDGEGPESAALARRWVREQPRGLYRARSDAGVEGFSLQVYLPAGDDLTVDDPVAAAVMLAVDQHGPLRPGERVNVNRYSGATGHLRDPMLLLVNGVSCILEWTHQTAAWTFIVTIDADHYGPYFEHLGLSPMLRVQQPGHDAVGYGWDRRRFPMPALFELMARRELSGEIGPPAAELLRPAPLSRPVFADGVRTALLQLSRPDRLAQSPLLGSALVDPMAPEPVDELRDRLLAAITALSAERRGAEHRRVLERTYLRGARSQEVAAELLGLPFSTYRRHLSQAHERLVEVLWSVEIGERPAPTADRRPEQEVATD